MIMDPFTKKVLWEFWIKSNDHEGVANDGFFDAEEGNNDDEQEIAEIFRIETNLFDYETPLCTEFKEFNFLLKVDPELVTYDIEGTKTYEEYENELNDELEEPWSEDGIPYEIYEVCNGGELPGMVRGDASQSVMNFYAWLKRSFENFHKLDYELLVKLQDYWWKVNDHECSPCSEWRNHIKGPYANYYSNFLDKEEHEDKDKHELFDDQKRLVCNIRRFEIIKYSFGKDEEYVAIKECEYDDLTITNEDACRAYQEIFRSMDEGWMVTRAE
ncbi:hypothetical protein Tco_0335550 [Tanacetum coccineum]